MRKCVNTYVLSVRAILKLWRLMLSLQKLNVLEAETYRTCDPIPGDSITVEAVEGAIRHLKPMHSSGADSLTPEHQKHCGSIFKK